MLRFDVEDDEFAPALAPDRSAQKAQALALMKSHHAKLIARIQAERGVTEMNLRSQEIRWRRAIAERLGERERREWLREIEEQLRPR